MACKASKHDHPDYGDADLDASQKVQKANWSCRCKPTVLATPKEQKDQDEPAEKTKDHSSKKHDPYCIAQWKASASNECQLGPKIRKAAGEPTLRRGHENLDISCSS
jgi:hypothetical protein